MFAYLFFLSQDEAFSLAQSSRPNLITRAALVDQAFALSAYDINTIEKYDLHLAELSEMIFPPAAPTAVDILNSNEQKQQQLDAVTRDRIIQYQTNLLTAKRLIPTSGPSQQHHEPPPSSDHPDTTGFVTPNAKGPRPPPAAVATTTARRSLNCTPPATLVAALRRVCCGGEDEQMDLSTAALAELSLEAVSSSFEDTTEANDASTATKPTTSNNNKNSPPGGSDASRKSSFDFRQLLQSVYSHAVFPHSIIQTTTTVADDDVGETGSGSSRQTPRDGGGEDDAAQNVNLEKLILNVAQLVADPHADSEDTLQALLMAIVSLSTARSQQQPLLYKGSPLGKVGTHIDITDLSSVPVIQTATRQDPDDLPIQSFLQVGPLMSVFSCTPSLSPSRSVGSASPATNSLDKATAENKDGTRGNTAPESDGSAATDVGHLEPALLEYFASAAAVYQERSEIQAVWRLQRATRATAEAAAVLADSEKTSNAGDFLRPQTPLPDLVLSSPLSQKDDENDHTDSHMRLLQPQVLDEDSYDSIAERPSETPTASSNGNPDMEDSQRDAPISSNPPTIDDPNVVVQPEPSAAVSAALSVSRNDEAHDVMAENEVGSSDSESEDDGEMSDQDDGGDDDEEPYESHSEGMMDDVATGLDDGEHPDHDDVEAGDDSSSSESSDDDGIGDSDGDAVETDEDDEVFLRQALALSMAAQQEVAAPADREGGASDEGTLTIESTHILVVPSTENDIQSFEEAIAPALEESLAHLSSSVTVTADAEKQPTTTQPDDTEANYPPFPNPPELYFDFCSKSSISAVRDDPDAPIPSRFPIPSLNPSEFGEFGSLPTSHVLVQLLRFASNSLLERHLFVGLRPEVPSPLVTGGMCTTLFSLDRQSKNHQPLLLKTQTESIKDHVSVLLLVVSLILFIEQRNDAIENLLQAFKREQRVVRQSDVDTSNDDDIDDESTRAPMSSSGEEDDPALAFAMNYVEDDVPLSESLENKGMMRKAAAAAHDVAAMVESLRARTQAWKTEVALLSTCAVYALRMLSRFIQTVVRHSLPHDTTNEATTVSHSFRLYRCLPVFLSSKVTDCLTSLITVGTQDRALFGLGYDEIEAEGSFLSLRLYREALCLWGEFVPLLYTSESSRLNLLELSISDCSAVASQLHISPIPDVSRLTTVPTTEIAPQVHKLKVLCRRLRISDMLDGFVSRPIPFVHEIDEKMSDHDTEELSKGPHMSSYLVSLLGKSTKNLIGGRIDVECLLYAVCHRYHTKMLLLDGFYAASPTESIDRYSSASSAKTLSTGDTVRVATGPSPSLQFDASNCSDSIALIAEHGDESADMNIGTGSVHQRASKVWGTVLSTHQFSPKTGVHRWAVRLDKCERGHVFIGVSTAQASTSTYVGGDKFGWGMIGTQALWHDRRKVRSSFVSRSRHFVCTH